MTASLALITCRFSITLYCYYLVSVASVVPGITLYECLASFVFFFFYQPPRRVWEREGVLDPRLSELE